MTLPVMKSQIGARIASLEKRLESIYEMRQINERLCFVRPDGSLFALDSVLVFSSIVIGYADDESAARINCFEDGDLFSMEELDEDAMFQAILHEVAQ